MTRNAAATPKLNAEERAKAASFYAAGVEELRRGVTAFRSGVYDQSVRQTEEYQRAASLEAKMSKTILDFQQRLDEILNVTKTNNDRDGEKEKEKTSDNDVAARKQKPPTTDKRAMAASKVSFKSPSVPTSSTPRSVSWL